MGYGGRSAGTGITFLNMRRYLAQKQLKINNPFAFGSIHLVHITLAHYIKFILF